MRRGLRSQFDAKNCGGGTANRKRDSKCPVQRDDVTDEYEAVCSQRIVLQNMEDIVDREPKPLLACVKKARYTNCVRWFLVIPLILLSVLAAVFASQSEEVRRFVVSYASPITSTEFVNKTLEIMKIHRIYHYFSPVIPASIVEPSAPDYRLDIASIQNRFAGIRQRLSALETAVQDLTASRRSSLINENELDKEIKQLHFLYGDLVSKANQLVAEHDKQTEVDARASMSHLAEDIHGFGQTLAEFADEKQGWQRKIDELITANERTQRELAGVSDRIESFAKRDSQGCTPAEIASEPAATEDVSAVIAAAIAKYDADKTGLADFALESGGGSIVGIRCTETYAASTRQETLFGIPIWYKEYSPRTVIQPGFAPGECWAFKGSHGYLTIKLSGVIEVTGVSYEHISRSISPTGNIDSAPKTFEVYALANAKDEEGLRLGTFKFDSKGPSLQYFPVEVTDVPATNFVELRVLSNYGHPVYTCLYRFRVHGKRVEPAYGSAKEAVSAGDQ